MLLTFSTFYKVPYTLTLELFAKQSISGQGPVSETVSLQTVRHLSRDIGPDSPLPHDWVTGAELCSDWLAAILS